MKGRLTPAGQRVGGIAAAANTEQRANYRNQGSRAARQHKTATKTGKTTHLYGRAKIEWLGNARFSLREWLSWRC